MKEANRRYIQKMLELCKFIKWKNVNVENLEKSIIIRSRETKTEIMRCKAINLAKTMVEHFEQQDKDEGIYTPNYYEIYNEKTKEVIDI